MNDGAGVERVEGQEQHEENEKVVPTASEDQIECSVGL